MHDVFSDWERRAILFYLQEREERAGLDHLARQVVAWRRGSRTLPDEDDEAVERTRDRLRYSHVMKMAEFGILNYRPRSDEISLSTGVQVSVEPPWTADDDSR